MIVLYVLFVLMLLELTWFNLCNIILLFKSKKHIGFLTRKVFPCTEDKDLPSVTIQIPIYNEFNAIAVADAVALDWPKEKLQIQVLDDSWYWRQVQTRRVLEHNYPGVEHICRDNRKGFKAGALQNALASAKGDFIVVFDADFRFEKDWLKKVYDRWRWTLYNYRPLACIQTRWTYRNRNANWITKVAAVLLDAHFKIEKVVRNYQRQFVGFNGSGGMWLKKAIEDAGGWNGDTLSEDTDLSYRVQKLGWKIKYCPQITCSSELPTEIGSFVLQQMRWARGSVGVAKKQLIDVLGSKEYISKKISAFFNLFGWNFSYLFGFIALLFFITAWQPMWLVTWAFFAGMPFLLSLPYYSAVAEKKREVWDLMAVGLVLYPFISYALLSELFGFKTEFVRTPKKGI